MARARAQEPVAREDHGDRLVDDGLHARNRDALGFLDDGAPVVAEALGVFAQLLRRELAPLRRRAEEALERRGFLAQLVELLLDANPLEARELAEPDLQDVVGLALREPELLHELVPGLVGLADEADHFLDAREDDEAPFEDVDALGDFVRAKPQPSLEHDEPELRPFGDRLGEPHLPRPPVAADRDQVQRDVRLHRRMREEERHQLLGVDAARARLEEEAHRVLRVGIVARGLQQGEGRALQVRLLGAHGFLAGTRLGVGDLLDLGEHLRGGGVGRQMRHRDAVLAPRELFHAPARAHPDAAAPGLVGALDLVTRRNDLATAGKVRALDAGNRA